MTGVDCVTYEDKDARPTAATRHLPVPRAMTVCSPPSYLAGEGVMLMAGSGHVHFPAYLLYITYSHHLVCLQMYIQLQEIPDLTSSITPAIHVW